MLNIKFMYLPIMIVMGLFLTLSGSESNEGVFMKKIKDAVAVYINENISVNDPGKNHIDLNKKELQNFLEKIATIIDGDNLEQIKKKLGEPSVSGFSKGKKSNSPMRMQIKYYLKKKEKNTVNTNDVYVWFIFDDKENFQKALFVNGIKNQKEVIEILTKMEPFSKK